MQRIPELDGLAQLLAHYKGARKPSGSPSCAAHPTAGIVRSLVGVFESHEVIDYLNERSFRLIYQYKFHNLSVTGVNVTNCCFARNGHDIDKSDIKRCS